MWQSYGKYAVVRKVGDKYKLTVCADNTFALMGYESKGLPKKKRGEAREGESPEGKLAQSIQRAKKTVFELGCCNEWEYFITLTLDPAKYDRHNLNQYHKELTKWLSHYSERKNGEKISFLLVPEQHKDGAWHMHGLIHGLRPEFLTGFVPGVHPSHLVGKGYKNWPAYAEKFGFCSLAPIKDSFAVSCYITKYITKDTSRLNQSYGAHLYYPSRPLSRGENVFFDFFMRDSHVCYDYVDEHCGIKTYDNLDDVLALFSQSVEFLERPELVEIHDEPPMNEIFPELVTWFENMEFEEIKLNLNS